MNILTTVENEQMNNNRARPAHRSPQLARKFLEAQTDLLLARAINKKNVQQ